MSRSLNNGRFSGINEDDFDSEKGVALALDNDSTKRVIVKAIFPRKTSELENARREAQTLAQLDHRNVVKFVDFLENEKPEWIFGRVCFLVTEFCRGGTLVEFIEKKKEAGQRTTADEARIIAAQLVSALSFCHDQKPAIVHQDIKPANVFVMDDYITIKLGDFGSAATMKSVTQSMTASGVKYTMKYGAPEMFNDETVKKSAQLDVWGFALVLQEVLTLEHAFGRVPGRLAGFTEIQVNIQRHEDPISTRTRLVHVFGQAHEFADFEALLEKCTRADRNRRPKNAIELRNEDVFSVFRYRLENGERACDIVQPPFEDQKNRQIRLLKEEFAEKMRQKDEIIERQNQVDYFLKEELATKDRLIAELRNRLNTAENSSDELAANREITRLLKEELTEEKRKVADLENRLISMRQNNEIIETRNQENSQMKNEIAKLKNEAAKMRPIFAKMESELNEARNLIQQLKTEHESEREQWKKETNTKIRAPKPSLRNIFGKNAKKQNEEGNQGRVVEKKEIERKNDKLEKMRNELGELGGAGHFWRNDNAKSCGGERDYMREAELKKVLRLLAAGETKINLKFRYDNNWNVAEAGWTIQFKTADERYGGDGKYCHLWLERKDGRAKFKSTAQRIHSGTGEEKNRRELQSETDGTRERIKYEYVPNAGNFIRFNITFL